MTTQSSLVDLVLRLGDGTELRAGGTDVMARHTLDRTAGVYVDLGGPEGVEESAGLRGITWRDDGGARVGALTTVAELAADPRVRAAYPGLAATAAALGTPQVRAVGTVGGNLLQRNRCWYYRNPRFSCFQSGGEGCPARDGLTLYSVVVDQGPCVAPHPSSLAMALLAYDAVVDVHDSDPLSMTDLVGDGSDPTRDHTLHPDDVLVAVDLPVPAGGERAAYHRTIGRSDAEWPLVEAVAVVRMDGARIASVAVAVGGVARTPLRLVEVEALLVGEIPSPERLLLAAAATTGRCAPLPHTGYKVGLLRDTVLEVLERATGDD